MKRRVRIYAFVLILTSLIFQSRVQISDVQAQSSITFSTTEVENNFPDQMVFQVTVTSTGADIVSAKFAYTNERLYGSKSYTKDPVEFTPGPTVQLSYTLDTRDLTTPPMMTYLYHWEVVDAEGNKIQNQETVISYSDNRYDWQILENDDIAVYWHDRPSAFGQTIFDIANEAVSYQQLLFQADLKFQTKIMISNSQEEFNSWHSIGHDWIGGQTFNEFGITNQIVEGSGYQDTWLNSVIPHELSHIYFNHAVYNPTVSVPVWINEGVAQYNEFITHEWEVNQVDNAASSGSLIPLAALEDGFGSYDVDRIYLSYAEAYSAAAYLIETYGNDGLSSLLAAYQDGEATEEAFQSALGITIDQFELDWAESVGAVDYLIPTPWALPTFFPSPTVSVPGSQGSTNSGNDPAQTPQPPNTDLITGEKDPASAPIMILPLIALGSIFLLSLLVGILIIFKKRD